MGGVEVMRTKRRRLIPEEREKRIQRAIEPVLNLFETNEFPKAVAIAALERQGGAIPVASPVVVENLTPVVRVRGH